MTFRRSPFACLAKPASVIGMSGKTHGVTSASRPPPTAASRKAFQLVGAVLSADGAGAAAALLNSGRAAPAVTVRDGVAVTVVGGRQIESLQTW